MNASNCSQIDARGNAFYCSEMVVQIPLSRTVGTVNVTITQPNLGSCGQVMFNLPNSFTYIISDVFVLFANPPLLPSLVTFDVTLYTSGLTQPTTNVWLLDNVNNTRLRSLNFTVTGNSFNRFLVRIPAGLAASSYGLEVAGLLCNGFLSNALSIVDVTQPDISSITPSIVWTGRNTGVRLLFTGNLSAGASVFISNSVSANSTAISLPATLFESSTSMTAVIPALNLNLPAGSYDVVVLNPPPSNFVFKKLQGLRIQTLDPIQALSMSPQFFFSTTGGAATVKGLNFVPNITAARSCIQQQGNAFVPLSVSPSSLAVTFVDNETLTVQGKKKDVVKKWCFFFCLFEIKSVLVAAVSTSVSYFFCNLVLTAPDGSVSTFSGFTMGGTSYNPTAWIESPSSMIVPRFGHTLAGGRIGSSRIVYAIGGLNASTGTALNSVEFATADDVGTLAAWSADRQALPAATQYGCACIVESFVYLMGGAPATTTSRSSVYRAMILQPLHVPEVTSIDVLVNASNPPTFIAGFYVYRVSAVFNPSYTRNPSGETLPSQVKKDFFFL